MKNFWETGKQIKEVSDVYQYMAIRYGLENFKMFDPSSLFNSKGSHVPDEVVSFIGKYKEVVGMAEAVGGEPIMIVFRALREKEFCTWSVIRGALYGLGRMSGFTYGQPIVLVEGQKDAECGRQLYPWVVSVRGAGLGTIGREILKTLTDKFILYYDADKPGAEAVKRDTQYLSSAGCSVRVGMHPLGVNDMGTIIDKEFRHDTFGRTFLEDFYRQSMGILSEELANVF